MLPLLELPEHRRILQAQLYVERHRDQDDAEQERYAPGPGPERLLSDDRRDHEEDGVTEQEPYGDARLGEAAVETPSVFGGVLCRQEHSSSPLAADGETLHKAQHEKQYGRRNPYGGVGRQHTDQRRRRSHSKQRYDEGWFTAEPIPEVAEEDSSYRTRHEAYRSGAEGSQHPGNLTSTGEIQRTEDQGRRRQVDKEVVPLDSRTGHRRQRYFPHRGRTRSRRLRTRICHTCLLSNAVFLTTSRAELVGSSLQNQVIRSPFPSYRCEQIRSLRS